MDFAGALAIVLAEEGGFVNDPDDPGGATNFGITQGTFTAWLAAHREPDRSVATITPDESAAIYRGIWQAAGCDMIAGVAPRLAALVFDTAVNMGERRTVKRLQYVLDAGQDGVVGPGTLGTLRRAIGVDPASSALRESLIAADFAFVRLAAYAAIVRARPASLKFLAGWIIRVDRVRTRIGFPLRSA